MNMKKFDEDSSQSIMRVLDEDMFYVNILPQFPRTDLKLVLEAFPSLQPYVDKYINASEDKNSTITESFNKRFPLSVKPSISPSTGTFSVSWDSESHELQLYDLREEKVVATAPVDYCDETYRLKITEDEVHVLLIREDAFTAFEISKSTENEQKVVRLTKTISVHFRPNDNDFIKEHGIEVHSSQVLAKFDVNSSTWAVARISYELSMPKEVPSKVMIDTVVGKREDMHNEPWNGFDYRTEPRTQTSVPIRAGSGITDAWYTSDRLGRTEVNCETIVFGSNAYPRIRAAEILLNPVRVHFPPNSLEVEGVLVNPTLSFDGPWIEKYSEDDDTSIHYSSISPSLDSITITRRLDENVSIERMSRCKQIRHAVRLPVASDKAVLEVMQSGDGRLVAVLYGEDHHDFVRIHGWAVCDVKGGGVVHAELQDGPKDVELDNDPIGQSTDFNRNFDISCDGQLIAAVVQRQRDEPRHTIAVFSAATGRVLTTVQTDPLEGMNADTYWDWKSRPGTGACELTFSKKTPGRMVMARKTLWEGSFDFSIRQLQV